MRGRNHPGMAAEARRLMERTPRTARLEAAGQVALFSRSFPTTPPAVVEQLVAPVPTTNQHGYEKWRVSELGQRVYELSRQRALELARSNPKRIGLKAVFEWIRDNHHLETNNTWTSFVARELRDTIPALRPYIYCRERKST